MPRGRSPRRRNSDSALLLPAAAAGRLVSKHSKDPDTDRALIQSLLEGADIRELLAHRTTNVDTRAQINALDVSRLEVSRRLAWAAAYARDARLSNPPIWSLGMVPHARPAHLTMELRERGARGRRWWRPDGYWASSFANPYYSVARVDRHKLTFLHLEEWAEGVHRAFDCPGQLKTSGDGRYTEGVGLEIRTALHDKESLRRLAANPHARLEIVRIQASGDQRHRWTLALSATFDGVIDDDPVRIRALHHVTWSHTSAKTDAGIRRVIPAELKDAVGIDATTPVSLSTLGHAALADAWLVPDHRSERFPDIDALPRYDSLAEMIGYPDTSDTDPRRCRHARTTWQPTEDVDGVRKVCTDCGDPFLDYVPYGRLTSGALILEGLPVVPDEVSLARERVYAALAGEEIPASLTQLRERQGAITDLTGPATPSVRPTRRALDTTSILFED